MATLRGIEDTDAALVLGEDVTNTAPRVALALRRTAHGRAAVLAAAKHIDDWQTAALADIGQHEKNPVFIASTGATRIDDIAAMTFRAAPDDLARLGFAVAHALNAAAPAVAGLDEATAKMANSIAAALLVAAKPLIVSGTGAGSAAVLQATANIARALHARGKAAEICLVVPEVNSLGFALLQAGEGGRDLEAAFSKIERGEADTLVVLENDLYRRADGARVDSVLGKVKLIVIDHQSHATSAKADVVLLGRRLRRE